MKRILFGLLLIVLVIPPAFYPVPATTAWHEKTILWTRFLGGGMGFGGRTPVLDPKNNRLYISSAKQVLCFDSTSGEQKWQRQFEDGVNGYLTGYTTIYNGNIIYGNKKGLDCLSKEDGKSIWRSSILVTSNIEIASNTIYVCSDDDIYKVDAKTGETISVVHIPDKFSYNFINIIDKNKVVASTSHGMKKLIDLRKSTIIWENNNDINELAEKPLVCGKYLVVFGYLVKNERLIIIELETGKELVNRWCSLGNIDASDGKLLTGDYCYSTETLEPLWESNYGYSRFFDCFDSIFFWQCDSYKICDWNGNKVAEKFRKSEKLRNSDHFIDEVWTKPASSDGRYYLLTSFGYLICYANKPETVTFNPGSDYLLADGKQVKLEHKPFRSDDGVLMVDPRGFLEPLGWVSSHDDDFTSDRMIFHDYEKQIAVASSTERLYTYDLDKIIPATKTEDGVLVIPFDTMVSEFGLTMTKEGDRIRLSYQSK